MDILIGVAIVVGLVLGVLGLILLLAWIDTWLWNIGFWE